MAKFSLHPFQNKNYPFTFDSNINSNSQYFYLGFELFGDLSSIDFGPYTPNKNRQMNLWKKTCFEFFLCHENGHYLEFNFSANFAWNTFSFTELRGSLTELSSLFEIDIDILNSSEKFSLMAKIEKNKLPEIFRDEKKLKFGVTGVVQFKNLTTEYWALCHKDKRPNFHVYESFIGKF